MKEMKINANSLTMEELENIARNELPIKRLEDLYIERIWDVVVHC